MILAANLAEKFLNIQFELYNVYADFEVIEFLDAFSIKYIHSILFLEQLPWKNSQPVSFIMKANQNDETLCIIMPIWQCLLHYWLSCSKLYI